MYEERKEGKGRKDVTRRTSQGDREERDAEVRGNERETLGAITVNFEELYPYQKSFSA